jgi:hypothetical protein
MLGCGMAGGISFHEGCGFQEKPDAGKGGRNQFVAINCLKKPPGSLRAAMVSSGCSSESIPRRL